MEPLMMCDRIILDYNEWLCVSNFHEVKRLCENMCVCRAVPYRTVPYRTEHCCVSRANDGAAEASAAE
jgi:hypothetical protein